MAKMLILACVLLAPIQFAPVSSNDMVEIKGLLKEMNVSIANLTELLNLKKEAKLKKWFNNARARVRDSKGMLLKVILTTTVLIGVPALLAKRYKQKVPMNTFMLWVLPQVQSVLTAAAATLLALINLCLEVHFLWAVLLVLTYMVTVIVSLYFSYQSNKHLYSATLSFNYFTDDGYFTFAAWKQIPLVDISISKGEAHWFTMETTQEDPFYKLNFKNPVHMKIIKALGLQLSSMFSAQWTEHICGGVPYEFVEQTMGLVFERDPKATGTPILQWRIFIVATADLKRFEGEGKFQGQGFPTQGQKKDRFEKMKMMKRLYDLQENEDASKREPSLVTISVPIRKKKSCSSDLSRS